MSAVQFFLPHLTATVAGIALPGAQFEFLLTGTTTPQTVYSNSGLTIPRTNPVVCNGVGALPTTYLDNTKTYRLRIYDKSGALLDGGDIDPFIPGTIPDASVLQPYVDDAEDAAVASSASATASAASAATALAVLSSTSILANATAHAATRTVLAAMNTALGPAYLFESGREGMFAWDSSNLSAQVTLDPRQGLYVAPASDPTGASGAWARKFSGPVNIRWLGAVGDGTTDDYAAIAAAVVALGSNGGWILIPEGKFRSSQQVVLTTGVHLIGERYGRNSSIVQGVTYAYPDFYFGSVLYFDSGVKGIILYSHTDTSDATTVVAELAANGTAAVNWKYQSANFSAIEHLAILSAGGGTTATHGLETRTILKMTDCVIRNFGGNGVEISASSDATLGGGDDYGNADLSTFTRVSSLGNRGDGFHAIGRDANVIKFDSCGGQGNTGWGFNDEGFLGNCYVNCHTASNTAGSYRGSNVNAAHTYIGCYSEGGATDLNVSCTVIGGFLGLNSRQSASVTAFVQAGGIAARAAYRHTNTLGAVSIGSSTGRLSTDMAAFSFGRESGSSFGEWKLQYAPRGSNDSWGFCYGNSTSAVPIMWPDGTTRTGRAYACEFPQGICPGDEFRAVTRLIQYGTAAPVAGTWAVGDIVLNKAPAANGVFLWRCTAAGTPGTWEALTLGAMTPTSIAATSFITSSGGGIGYATGAGGTVTQITSRTTGVTLNKLCGAITLVSAAGTATWQSFTVTNSQVAATDVIRLNQKSGTDKYMLHVTAVGAGSFEASFATTGGTTVEQPVFNFAVIKAVAA